MKHSTSRLFKFSVFSSCDSASRCVWCIERQPADLVQSTVTSKQKDRMERVGKKTQKATVAEWWALSTGRWIMSCSSSSWNLIVWFFTAIHDRITEAVQCLKRLILLHSYYCVSVYWLSSGSELNLSWVRPAVISLRFSPFVHSARPENVCLISFHFNKLPWTWSHTVKIVEKAEVSGEQEGL